MPHEGVQLVAPISDPRVLGEHDPVLESSASEPGGVRRCVSLRAEDLGLGVDGEPEGAQALRDDPLSEAPVDVELRLLV